MCGRPIVLITRLITEPIRVHSVLLPLLIHGSRALIYFLGKNVDCNLSSVIIRKRCRAEKVSWKRQAFPIKIKEKLVISL